MVLPFFRALFENKTKKTHPRFTSGKLFFFSIKDLYRLNLFNNFPSVEWHKLLNVNCRKVAIPAAKPLETLNMLQEVVFPVS